MSRSLRTRKELVTCDVCHIELPRTHQGRCPKCGGVTTININVSESTTIRDVTSMEYRREFYERNPTLKWVVIGITAGSPLLGLIAAGWVGVIIGLVFGAASYYLGAFAVRKVLEIFHIQG